MSQRRKRRGTAHAHGLPTGFLRPGVTVMEVRHDAWCAIWRTQRSDDCTCEPNIVLRPVASPKNGGKS